MKKKLQANIVVNDLCNGRLCGSNAI